jgi:hypothetical protein
VAGLQGSLAYGGSHLEGGGSVVTGRMIPEGKREEVSGFSLLFGQNLSSNRDGWKTSQGAGLPSRSATKEKKRSAAAICTARGWAAGPQIKSWTRRPSTSAGFSVRSQDSTDAKP